MSASNNVQFNSLDYAINFTPEEKQDYNLTINGPSGTSYYRVSLLNTANQKTEGISSEYLKDVENIVQALLGHQATLAPGFFTSNESIGKALQVTVTASEAPPPSYTMHVTPCGQTETKTASVAKTVFDSYNTLVNKLPPSEKPSTSSSKRAKEGPSCPILTDVSFDQFEKNFQAEANRLNTPSSDGGEDPLQALSKRREDLENIYKAILEQTPGIIRDFKEKASSNTYEEKHEIEFGNIKIASAEGTEITLETQSPDINIYWIYDLPKNKIYLHILPEVPYAEGAEKKLEIGIRIAIDAKKQLEYCRYVFSETKRPVNWENYKNGLKMAMQVADKKGRILSFQTTEKHAVTVVKQANSTYEDLLPKTERKVIQTFDEKSQEEQDLIFKDTFEYILGFIQALEGMHSKKIFHGDLKPLNILYYPTKTKKTRIIDAEGAQDISKNSIRADFDRTPAACPPEFFLDSELSLKFDIYSAGVTLFDLLYGADNSVFSTTPSFCNYCNDVCKSTLDKDEFTAEELSVIKIMTKIINSGDLLTVAKMQEELTKDINKAKGEIERIENSAQRKDGALHEAHLAFQKVQDSLNKIDLDSISDKEQDEINADLESVEQKYNQAKDNYFNTLRNNPQLTHRNLIKTKKYLTDNHKRISEKLRGGYITAYQEQYETLRKKMEPYPMIMGIPSAMPQPQPNIGQRLRLIALEMCHPNPEERPSAKMARIFLEEILNLE